MEEYKTRVPMDNETKIAITAILCVLVFLLAVIGAFFFDEVLDRSTEQTCVEKQQQNGDGDDYIDCDV